MTDEKNIPAQQEPPKKDPRLPRPDEDCGRPQGAQPQTPQGPRDADGVKFSFPKSARFLSRRDFESFKGRSSRLAGSYLCVDVGSSPSSRLGITASRKYGSAVERNRFKRLVREAYRQHRHEWPLLDLHVVPRQRAKQAKLIDIETELKQLVHAQRTPT